MKTNVYVRLSLCIYLFFSHTVSFPHSLVLLSSSPHLSQASLALVRVGERRAGGGVHMRLNHALYAFLLMTEKLFDLYC